eukprot:5278262-Pyramimonas_sp.AAC.1
MRSSSLAWAWCRAAASGSRSQGSRCRLTLEVLCGEAARDVRSWLPRCSVAIRSSSSTCSADLP